MTDPMVAMIAKKFIQRRDVKAIQTHSGAYIPVTDNGRVDGNRLPFMARDLEDHITGKHSYGHYLIDHADQCKLFAFDIDLNQIIRDKDGNVTWETSFPAFPDMSAYVGLPEDEAEYFSANTVLWPLDPRAAWRDRAHPARNWLKYQLRMVGEKLSRVISEDLGLPTAMAYSGSKGIHVYAFTGPISAHEARDAAETVLALTGEFELSKGKNFYKHKNQDPVDGFPCVEVELFPKQGSIKGKDIGNLMRLPLGRNIKSPDPTFFVDQRAPMARLQPHPDPVALLESGRPWL